MPKQIIIDYDEYLELKKQATEMSAIKNELEREIFLTMSRQAPDARYDEHMNKINMNLPMSIFVFIARRIFNCSIEELNHIELEEITMTGRRGDTKFIEREEEQIWKYK